MSEMRLNEVIMAGRIFQGPVKTKDGLAHFMLEAARDSDPFHCVCDGRTAETLLEYCAQGDELSIEGVLHWINFPNTGKELVIYTRHASYGRKSTSLR